LTPKFYYSKRSPLPKKNKDPPPPFPPSGGGKITPPQKKKRVWKPPKFGRPNKVTQKKGPNKRETLHFTQGEALKKNPIVEKKSS